MTRKSKSSQMNSLEELELQIMRNAVDNIQEDAKKEFVRSPEVQKLIEIVEKFLRKKKNICYGGTAINNILPSEDQFYDKSLEIPDYDFFSKNAMDDARELADVYAEAGYEEIEAKSGVHKGTYKVFVNYVPVADITQIDEEIFKNMYRESINILGIHYAPPNYLRMAMYLELSRPAGDVSRWEKVLKRLTLLNKNYPLTGYNCDKVEYQRIMTSLEKEDIDTIYDLLLHSLIQQGVVFFRRICKFYV